MALWLAWIGVSSFQQHKRSFQYDRYISTDEKDARSLIGFPSSNFRYAGFDVLLDSYVASPRFNPRSPASTPEHPIKSTLQNWSSISPVEGTRPFRSKTTDGLVIRLDVRIYVWIYVWISKTKPSMNKFIFHILFLSFRKKSPRTRMHMLLGCTLYVIILRLMINREK